METTKLVYMRLTDNVDYINRIDYSIYSNEDVIKYSALDDVNGLVVADISNNGEPIPGGTIDKRLGVIENKVKCITCGENGVNCIGHFGHIKLVDPVFHMGFIKSFLKNILSCICIRCKKLLVHKNEPKIKRLIKNKNNKQRFAEIRDICKKLTHCQKENYGCGAPVHKITIDEKNANVFILAETVKNDYAKNDKKKITQILTPQLCYVILSLLSDEDCMILGFDRSKSKPEDMIIMNFPVPPIQVRPVTRVETTASYTSDDDLTHKLIDIIRHNENLKDTRGEGSLIKSTVINDDFMFLQFHIATFYANDIINLPKSLQKNKTVTRSLSERLKGKEGRIRGNLMGKRVNMSGRTVITPDPNISLSEVGVPLIIAMNLTYPEVVTSQNRQYLTTLVNHGTQVYPGANFVIKNIITKDGTEESRSFSLKNIKNPIPIEIGDIVERHLVTGDILMFNRQPSLHKLSMMGHTIHVINDPKILTLRMNVTATDPYNADFDGDEMNIHIPQSIQTVTEIRLIANISYLFVNPATSRIAINAGQDSLIGSYLLTFKNIKINWKDAMNYLMCTSVGMQNLVPKGTLLDGKYIFSQIIPKGLNLSKKMKDDTILKIQNGLILSGYLTSSEIANIIHKSWFRYGSIQTKTFADDLQKMLLQWLMNHGFTISVEDIIIPQKIRKSLLTIIETKRKQINASITEYENDPYILERDVFETTLKASLQSIQGEIEKNILGYIKDTNNIYVAITCGSEGTSTNAGQIIGCIGQVIVEGKRIQKKFNNRALPMFHQNDDGAFARGFCYNSYGNGIDPAEFFFQAMASREGIIDKSVKTADTGYIQRRLVKVLEDIRLEYDGTVRNANDKIIQFVYGDNGISTEKQLEQKIALMRANNQKVAQDYIYSEEELKTHQKTHKNGHKYTMELNKKLYKKLIRLRDKMRHAQYYTNSSHLEFTDTYMMPVDLQQYIFNVINGEKRTGQLVDPYYVLSKIKELYAGPLARIMKYNPEHSVIKKMDDARIKLLTKLYLYDTLSPRRCTHEYHLTTEEFDDITSYYQEAYLRSQIRGVEMVGIVSAQSIGEPVTQSNLRSFQKSGTGKSVFLGLPRVKELLSITRKIKSPQMVITLDKAYRDDKFIATKISSHLKYTCLQDIADNVKIYYDPNPYEKGSIMQTDQVLNIFEGNAGKIGCQKDISNLQWIIRIVLSKDKMFERNINMLDIKSSFCINWSSRNEDVKNNRKEYKKIIQKITKCAIISNYDNSPVPIIHIRFDANNYNIFTLVQFQEMILTKYKIKGMQNIHESNDIVHQNFIDFDSEGNIVTDKKQYIITTEGINMDEITKINGIDLSKLICNDISIIYETFGVEAARVSFIKEFVKAIGSSGGTANFQHIEILADAITHMGGLIAVNRHGANKLDTDPLSRASFEQTIEQMLSAAAFGESDYIRSIASKIMIGSLINGGTGCFDILLDTDLVKETKIPISNKTAKQIVLAKNKTVLDILQNG